jgi:ribosomal protein L12E/L44/L45/RPP1/RPP2
VGALAGVDCEDALEQLGPAVTAAPGAPAQLGEEGAHEGAELLFDEVGHGISTSA